MKGWLAMNGADASTTNHEPLTVLMPVRNGASFLPLSLADIVSGLLSNDEVLVINDGSDDATSDVLATWQERDARIRSITIAPRGLVEALNLGIRESRHEWIARADADDRYPLTRFNVQRAARAEGVAAIVGDYSLVSPDASLGTIPCALGPPFVALSALNPQRIPHPGTMLCRAAVLAAGGYLPEEFPAEDLGLWLRLMQVGQFVGVASPVVEWRLSAGSTSATRRDAQRAKTRSLIEQFPLDVIGGLTDEQVEAELGHYRTSSLGAERTVLLGRDLLVARRRGVRVPMESWMRSSAMHPLRQVRAAAHLARDMRLRRQFRQISS